MKKALSIVCVLLIIAAFVLQFTPYWSFGDKDYTIAGLVWTPEEKPYKQLQKDIKAEFEKDYTEEELKTKEVKAEIKEKTYLMSFVRGPIVIEALSLLSVLFFVLGLFNKRDSWLPKVLALGVGVFGVITYATGIILKLGASWGLHLALYVVILIVAALVFVPWPAPKKKAVELEL